MVDFTLLHAKLIIFTSAQCVSLWMHGICPFNIQTRQMCTAMWYSQILSFQQYVLPFSPKHYEIRWLFLTHFVYYSSSTSNISMFCFGGFHQYYGVISATSLWMLTHMMLLNTVCMLPRKPQKKEKVWTQHYRPTSLEGKGTTSCSIRTSAGRDTP